MDTCYLVRKKTSDQGTFGELTTPKGQVFQTGELPWRDNQEMISCIPVGQYVFPFVESLKFPEGTPETSDVPGRTGIRVHKGNWCGNKDFGFDSDVSGCIILGMTQGVGQNRSGNNQQGVFQSTVANAKFREEMGSNETAPPFLLVITEQFS